MFCGEQSVMTSCWQAACVRLLQKLDWCVSCLRGTSDRHRTTALEERIRLKIDELSVLADTRLRVAIAVIDVKPT